MQPSDTNLPVKQMRVKVALDYCIYPINWCLGQTKSFHHPAPNIPKQHAHGFFQERLFATKIVMNVSGRHTSFRAYASNRRAFVAELVETFQGSKDNCIALAAA